MKEVAAKPDPDISLLAGLARLRTQLRQALTRVSPGQRNLAARLRPILWSQDFDGPEAPARASFANVDWKERVL